MKALFYLLVAVALAYAAAAYLLGRERLLEVVFGRISVQPVDFKTLRLKETPNQFLMCPENYCHATPDAKSPVWNEPVASLKQRWNGFIDSVPQTDLVESDEAEDIYTYRTRTPLLRFPDDVTVQFVALDEGRSSLAIYSRSHYGYSDLGTNQRRVDEWISRLRQGS
jgi:uncharacterized protein (DUF1499 family)